MGCVKIGYPLGYIRRSQRQIACGRRPAMIAVNVNLCIPARGSETTNRSPRSHNRAASRSPSSRLPTSVAWHCRHPDPPPTRLSPSMTPTITTAAMGAILSAALVRSATIAAAAFEPRLLHGRRAHSPRLAAPPPRHRGKDPHPPPCCRHHQPSIQSLVPFSTQGWQPAASQQASQQLCRQLLSANAAL